MSGIFKIIKDRKREFYIQNESSNVKGQIALTLNGKENLNYVICPNCNENLYINSLLENNRVCYNCQYHFRMNSLERIKLIFDEESVVFFDENLVSSNPLEFPGYNEKLNELNKKLEINEAVITGKGCIFNQNVYFGVMDYRFFMGSMGSVVGEKLTRMIEKSTKERKPIIIFSASGGARMQEGMISLYQMAKVVAALEKHSNEGLLYISVLTDPTTGGVIASFASVGDIIIAEPNATIGFAGKRVTESITKEKMPENFQTSEFHFEKGHIDFICKRDDLKNVLSNLLKIYSDTIVAKEKVLECNFIENGMGKNIKNNDTAEWEKVKIARSTNRPRVKQYIEKIFDNFIELHGDRIDTDDKAIVTGIGYINNIPVTLIFNSKGNSLSESVMNNFGMTKPGGYRKVIRLSKLAEKFNMPIICFIDTPGACSGVEAENMGQSFAIASSIRNFSSIKVPTISIITGEGGSGGALAMGVADWIFILENSIYSVISPEGCASILFRDLSKVEECCKYLKLTSNELLSLGIVDEIIPEFGIDFNLNSDEFYYYTKTKIYNKLVELINNNINELVNNRYLKFRKHGVYNDDN